MKTNERFLEALKNMNATMKADNKAGKKWRYSNSNAKQAHTFPKARETGKRYTNCVLAVWWGLRAAGVPDKALRWQGVKGKIAFKDEAAKKEALKYFDLKSTEGKTIKQLYDQNLLCDGDVLGGFPNMNHTCVYYGGKQSFDAGHAYCSGSGEGAVYKKWIGSLTYKRNKPSHILRLKDRAHYRVQAGAYSDKRKFDEQAAKLRKAGFSVTMIEEGGMYKAQVGYFSGKTNADRLVATLKKKGFSAFMKEV